MLKKIMSLLFEEEEIIEEEEVIKPTLPLVEALENDRICSTGSC